MAFPKLSRLELQIMDALWTRGPCSVREVQESFPEETRPAYTTVLTIISRTEQGPWVQSASMIWSSSRLSLGKAMGTHPPTFVEKTTTVQFSRQRGFAELRRALASAPVWGSNTAQEQSHGRTPCFGFKARG